ncbi:hypothetical protein Scep_022093 [Stephania cephalantha]|uniref:Uncharacterized protein n=1 Tax=Stephania cephalantha TaxID=152367 RepID=A0AAP0FG66_9MAGN
MKAFRLFVTYSVPFSLSVVVGTVVVVCMNLMAVVEEAKEKEEVAHKRNGRRRR